MVTESKPLFNLTASDLMSTALVMVPQEMSLKGAAHLLAQAAVTGAPVVDQQGHCVGVLSATDFVHWMEREHQVRAACATSPAFFAAWQMLDTDALPDQDVRDCMTHDPVMVLASATIGELARKMIDVHIHRLIVVDKNNKPIGIVSSTDLLAALAKADQVRNSQTHAAKCYATAC
jgi:predicted transcriptional regulator